MKYLTEIALGIVAVVILLGVGSWVLRIGPFKPQPSAAAKVQTETTTAVEKAETEIAKGVDTITTEAQGRIGNTSQRTQDAVAEVRRVQRAAPVTPAYPDAAFFRGVCQSVVYAGHPECRGYRSQPEGRDPPAR